MPSSTVRIRPETHATLRELADDRGESLQDVLSTAVERMRRQWMLEVSNSAYAELRADAVAWEAERDERAEWETTFSDGLED